MYSDKDIRDYEQKIAALMGLAEKTMSGEELDAELKSLTDNLIAFHEKVKAERRVRGNNDGKIHATTNDEKLVRTTMKDATIKPMKPTEQKQRA